MKESKMNMNDLLDVLTCAILVLDVDMRVVYMNQSGEMLFGQSQQRALAEPVAQLLRSEVFHEH